MRRHVVIVLALVTLYFGTAIRAAEQGSEAPIPTIYAEVQYMQVPEGGDELYLKVEDVWKMVHVARKELGITQASVVCKVKRTQGSESDYNYTVVHFFDSWGKIETPYPWDAIESKISPTDEEKKLFDKTSTSRKLIRTELWKLEDVAMPSRLGQTDFDKTILLGFMKSKKSGHLTHEKEVWKKLWAQACKDGLRSNWHVWNRRFPGGSKHAFDLVAVNFFPRGEFNKSIPVGWWRKAGQKCFPDKNPEEFGKLVQETNEMRDIPITEEWTILKKVGADE